MGFLKKIGREIERPFHGGGGGDGGAAAAAATAQAAAAAAAANAQAEALKQQLEEQQRAHAQQLEEQRAEAERQVQEEIRAERVRAHAERLREWQALNREYPIPAYLRPYIVDVLEDVSANAAQNQLVNIGVVGNSGTGKSFLIRSILTWFESPTDDVNVPRACYEGDGTRMPKQYILGGFTSGTVRIWDLPGQGTELFPARTYLCNMGLKYFDAVLTVTDGRWLENDVSLRQAIKFANIWCDVVRTKIDLAVADGAYDAGESPEEVMARVQRTLSEQVPEPDASMLHLVTTRRGMQFGVVDRLCARLQAQVRAKLERADP